MASRASQNAAGAEGGSFADWRSRVEKELDGADFRETLVTQSLEGVEIQPLYTMGPAPGARAPAGFPGLWPYTRGSRPGGSAEGGWLRCPRYETFDPEVVRQEILADLEGGATALWLRLDRAARLGVDPRERAADRHVGRDGTAVFDPAELARALEGVRHDGVVLMLDAGANALPAAAMALATLGQRLSDVARAAVFFCADPIAALCRDGGLPGSLEEAHREMGLLALHCASTLPYARAVAVSTVPYHDAGAHAVQELGWALATGVGYLRCLEEAGLEPDRGARQIAFRFAVGRDLFIEIAKLRAARRLWSQVLSGCGVEDPPAPWIHAVASRRTLSRRDPWVNILRVTTQVFAAAVGGADAITSAAFDEPLGRPEPVSRRLARNTQAILAEESHLGRVVDPGGGSYYIERLTEQLCQMAWLEFQEIERQGGMTACLVSGEIRRRVDDTWQKRRYRLEQSVDAVTGVSRYADPEERPLERSRGPTPEWIAERRARLQGLRRDQEVSGSTEIDRGQPLESLLARASRGAPLAELSRALNRAPATPASRNKPWPRRRHAALFEDPDDAADLQAVPGERPAEADPARGG